MYSDLLKNVGTHGRACLHSAVGAYNLPSA
jgi:hypothetical protein